jgi:PBP1b-binding outer membrane lipoprotein LpoB
MHALIEVPLKTIVLPALGAVALMFLAGCASDQNAPTASTTTTTTEETTSSAMPTPQTPPETTTTESTETHTVAPAQ